MPPIEIVPARVAWAEEFGAIAGALRAALGPLALRIDHIGSTSVPGLAAKDVVDVQVTVAALDLAALAPRLAGAGYEHRPARVGDHVPPGADGPAEEWAKLFFREAPGGRPTNVHVRVAGRANQRYPLLFRDYLRAHPAAAAAYAELKRRLAALEVDGVTYTGVKDPVCDLIVVAAEAWAAQGGWELGPSDG